MEKIKSSTENNFESFDNDDINLTLLLKFIFRNKFSLGIISLIFFGLSIVISFSQKRIWEGQFQIVLNSNEESDKLSMIDPTVASFLGGTQKNNLKTEVGILESPSVLMPIFEFANSEKKNIGSKKTKKLKFINNIKVKNNFFFNLL